MKNVIIAVENQKLFYEIKSCFNKKEFNVFSKDLIYEDAIFEIVENKEIDFLIIKECIIEDKKKFQKLLKKDIRILLFLENLDNIQIYKNYGFKEIFDIDNINRNFLNKYLFNIDDISNNKIIKEAQSLKDELISFKEINDNKKAEVIVFTGNSKSGKTTLALNMLNFIENKKVLYIDFNINNKDVSYVYDEVNNKNVSFIKYINKNEVTFLIKIKELLKSEKLSELLNRYVKIYDFIIIDLDKNVHYKNLKCIFIFTKKIFFIIEPIQLEIYTSISLLDFFKNNKLIDEEKVFIIFNKYDYNSVSIEILKEIFNKYKIECIMKRKMKYRRILNKDIKYGYRIRK